jgi:hypothetical protein
MATPSKPLRVSVHEVLPADDKRAASPGSIGCTCGGRLHPVKLTNYDASALFGRKLILPKASGYRCDGCGGEALDGATLNYICRKEVLRAGRIRARG